MRAGAAVAAVVLATVAMAASSSAAAPIVLQDQAWLAPTPDPAAALTRAPRECLARTSPQIEAGRALFSAPTVLGGPAARAGLSCAACHTAGRTNARFLLPELTDRAGAADVTSEWASKLRGDGRMNPVPIPDLAGAAMRPVYGAAQNPSLHAFIRGVVVEEFQGRDTAPVIDALTAYVAALDAACGAEDTPLSLDAALADIDRALAAAADPAGDPHLAGATLLAARHLIGRVAERTPPRPAFAKTRADLARLAADIGAARAPDGA
ncbi:MAG: hypothetical protein KJS97_15855, partial [Alphaproteobacteria bacterium]|nr:hypothetical protein [Alphaproteobacteria bacterium]